MTVTTHRLVAAFVAGGAMTCILTAMFLRPSPFPQDAGPRWISIQRSWTNPRAGGSYAVDTVVIGKRQRPYDGRPQVLASGETFDVHGWAFEPNFHRTAHLFVYRVDGGPWREATYHLPRPDVAGVLHLPNIADSGFDVVLPAGALAPGRHTLELATKDITSPPVPLPDMLTLDVRVR